MEWNRGSGPTQTAHQPVNHPASSPVRHKGKMSFLSMRLASVFLLFCTTILILAMVSFIAFGGPTPEHKFVSRDRMQAVFLNGGQVYFGRITNLNNKFMRMGDIYYLRVNQTVQPNGQQGNQDVSLVKLGCELHGPDDSMVINQDQIIFWENLKTDGQVAKAVADYKKQNPNGQKCDQQQNTNTTNTTPTTNQTTPTTNTTTPTTTTPTTNQNNQRR